jgi:hypothetical protein
VDREVIETRVTHTRRSTSAFDMYNRGLQWARTCAEVAFFVSVERLLNPSLRGKAGVVGGRRGGRGVVTSASYEVRAFGVRSDMSIREASERAPSDAVFVPGHHEAHSDYSARAREIVERFSPVVIAGSIDALPRLLGLRADVSTPPRLRRRCDDPPRCPRDDRDDRSRARAPGERGYRDEQTDGQGGQRAREATRCVARARGQRGRHTRTARRAQAAGDRRVPLGIAFDFNNTPLDIFLQIVPVLDFVSGDYNRYRNREHFGIDGSVGIRYWFK